MFEHLMSSWWHHFGKLGTLQESGPHGGSLSSGAGLRFLSSLLLDYRALLPLWPITMASPAMVPYICSSCEPFLSQFLETSVTSGWDKIHRDIFWLWKSWLGLGILVHVLTWSRLQELVICLPTSFQTLTLSEKSYSVEGPCRQGWPR